VVRGPVQEREAVCVVGEGGEVADLALARRRRGGARVVGIDAQAERGAVQAGEVEGNGAASEDGQGVVGVPSVEGGGGGEVGEVDCVGKDVGAGAVADPEQLGCEGVEGGPGSEAVLGAVGGRGGAQRGGVGAGGAVDAGVVGGGGKAGEGDVAAVGSVRVVVLHGNCDSEVEGGGFGGEGVVDVGAEGAWAGDEVNGVKGGAVDDAGDDEVAGLGRKVEVAARVVFAVDGAGEGPHVVFGLAGFGRDADIDGLGQQVGLQVGAEEVLRVDIEVEDGGGGHDGADGALRGYGGGGHVGAFVPVAVACDAEAGTFGWLAVAAVGLVGDSPDEGEDLFSVRDLMERDCVLAVGGREDGELGALGGVPTGCWWEEGSAGSARKRRAAGGRAVAGGGAGVCVRMGWVDGAGASWSGWRAWWGGRRETRGLVRDSCAENILSPCSTYTVFPSSEWTSPRSQPWRSR